MLYKKIVNLGSGMHDGFEAERRGDYSYFVGLFRGIREGNARFGRDRVERLPRDNRDVYNRKDFRILLIC